MRGAQNINEKIRLEERFFNGEFLDHKVYASLEKIERDYKLRRLLKRLADEEQAHMQIWSKLLELRHAKPRAPKLSRLRVLAFLITRKIFGVTFTTKLLERSESEGLNTYKEVLKGGELSKIEKVYLKRIIKDETGHELELEKEAQIRSGSLSYIQSIVFGLNDGLVEVLAAIAGLAAFSTSASFVVVGGIIVALSGTLSMTGGAYLAAKSQNIVEEVAEEGDKRGANEQKPLRNAYYTGIYYFLGALAPILPFAIGYKGFFGIGLAVLFTGIVLTLVSTVIAVIGDTSVKRRIFEMLLISLGASTITIFIGILARHYIGIAV